LQNYSITTLAAASDRATMFIADEVSKDAKNAVQLSSSQQVLWLLTTGNKKNFSIDCACFDTSWIFT